MNRVNRKPLRVTTARSGLTVRASPLWDVGNASKVSQLLTEDERAHLALIASIVRLKKGEKVLRAGEPVEAIYNIISGVVKSYAVEPDRSERINGFLFPGDVVGLSDEGKYSNTVEAITPVTAYRLPVSKLRRLFRREAEMEFHVICKLCQELRQSQRHAFLISRRNAVVRIAMFLQLLEELQANRGEPTSEIYLPMNRTEIGEFAGLSLAAVSRAFRKLMLDGVVEVRNHHCVKVKDREAFDHLAALAGKKG